MPSLTRYPKVSDAIFASSISKLGNLCSNWSRRLKSTRSTISTSVIHNTASVGKFELAHTSVLNLLFQHWNVEGSGHLSKCISETWFLGCSTMLCMRGRIPMWKRPCKSWCKNHAILRISFFCMRGRIPSWKRPCKSRCKYCETLSISIQVIRSHKKSSCFQKLGLASCRCKTFWIS